MENRKDNRSEMIGQPSPLEANQEQEQNRVAGLAESRETNQEASQAARRTEKSGRSIQEALSLALEELGADERDVDIEVIDEGTKGIFGLLGKEARVRVSLKDSLCTIAMQFLQDVFYLMDLDLEMRVREQDGTVYIDITGEESGIIIGRRGETLDALQYIAGLVVNKYGGRARVTIDVENYRRKREDTLVALANRVAGKVADYRKSITLEPMSPNERRIIHTALQDNRYVKTFSTGEDPNRRVVITLR